MIERLYSVNSELDKLEKNISGNIIKNSYYSW